MQIGESRPIRRPIPLTPLVDIVFLLLMFFMLSSTFTRFGDLQAGAAAGSAPPQQSGAFPGAIVVVEGSGRATVNGRRIGIEELPSALDRLAAKGVSRAAVRAGGGARVQDLVTALDVIRTSRISDVVVAR